MVGLGELPGGVFQSSACGVSADGSVVVGWSISASGGEAFRWTEHTGMVGLGDLPGGDCSSVAYSVSDDGSTIVGEGATAHQGAEAFRWTKRSGMVGLGELPGGDFESTATDVSGDGSVVVGRSQSAAGLEAFRWTSEVARWVWAVCRATPRARRPASRPTAPLWSGGAVDTA